MLVDVANLVCALEHLGGSGKDFAHYRRLRCRLTSNRLHF